MVDPAERPQAVAVDPAGNVLIVGERFAGENVVSAFSVMKLDPEGQPIWSRTYGDGAFTDSYRITAAADQAGNLVVAGELVGAGDFGGISLAAVGLGDAFVLKLDGNGDAIWGRTFGSTETVMVPGVEGEPPSEQKVATGASDVAVDAQGNVILVGQFEAHVDFGLGPVDAAAGDDFVVALDAADGATRWVRQLDQAWFPQVTTDPSGAVILGASAYAPGTSSGVTVTKIDAAGGQLWRQTLPGAILSGVSGIATDAAGDIVLTGSLGGQPLDFGDGPISSVGEADVYVAKLSPDGDAIWSSLYGGTDFVANSRLVVDASGGVILAAECRGIASLRGLPVLAAIDGWGVCVVRLDAEGKPLATTSFSTAASDQVLDMALTHDGNPILVGQSVDQTSGDVAGYRAIMSL
ncbi:MAG: hypothetical protein QM820_64475 [Minicystis sp.]